MMTSDKNRVFSTTTARENFSNNLASLSPAFSSTSLTSLMTTEMSSSDCFQDQLQMFCDSQQMVGTNIDVANSNTCLQPVSLKQSNKPLGKPLIDRKSLLTRKPQRASTHASVNRSPGEKSRYDTSLGLLTKRFIQLMHSSEDGILDLNQAAELLSVQKRRIYDITNVLEGIKLIEKRSKNNVQWLASKTVSSETDQSEIDACKVDVESLSEMEDELDVLIRQRQIELERLSENNSRYSYVTYQDIRSIKSFKEQIVICIKAPQDTKLEVPDPGEKIQMLLKSSKGEIDVFLCPDPHDIPSPSDNTSMTSSMTSPADENYLSDSTLENSPTKDDKLSHYSSPQSMQSYSQSILVEDGGISSMENPQHLLLQTEDQLGVVETEADSAFIDEDSSSFIALSPAIDPDDYLFSLNDSEGIAELFDINATELPNSDHMTSKLSS